MSYCASTTVQLLGIPLTPVVQLLILAAFVNVPLDATPLTKSNVQRYALISVVARHLIELRLVQLKNIPL